jgi:Domain of unknown function (DUF1833)
MAFSLTAERELAAQECGTAWLVLLTITHADLPSPLRFTSDSVETVSNGVTFQPFWFDIVLPDDVEGRTPRAQLRIDNTSQEVVALLRGLTTPPAITLQVVRATAPDVVEREWAGLEWRSSAFDVGFITGTLTIDDLATEEFPYETYDGRFKALWP